MNDWLVVDELKQYTSPAHDHTDKNSLIEYEAPNEAVYLTRLALHRGQNHGRSTNSDDNKARESPEATGSPADNGLKNIKEIANAITVFGEVCRRN